MGGARGTNFGHQVGHQLSNRGGACEYTGSHALLESWCPTWCPKLVPLAFSYIYRKHSQTCEEKGMAGVIVGTTILRNIDRRLLIIGGARQQGSRADFFSFLSMREGGREGGQDRTGQDRLKCTWYLTGHISRSHNVTCN
ncbi:unnamed protein product [Prunus armeniaca]